MLWTLDNWDGPSGIHTAEPWRFRQPSAWSSYYNQILTFNSYEEVEEPKVETDPPDNHYTVIGKNEPQYYTYNYATDGEFHLNKNANNNVTDELYGITDKALATDAIPATEKVTNGYYADKWYGTADLNNKSVSKTWRFNGTLKWTETETRTEHHADGSTSTKTHTVTRTKPYSYSVKRTAKYWYIANTTFYDLTKVTTKNDVFADKDADLEKTASKNVRALADERTYQYTDTDETEYQCYINGISVKTEPSQKVFTPKDDWHIDWDKNVNTNLGTVSGSSEGSAASSFRSKAEGRITPEKEIKVRNDKLVIDGNTYMNNDYYRNGDFTKSASTSPSGTSYWEIKEDDYQFINTCDQVTAKIPTTTANNMYYTTLVADYKKMSCADGTGRACGTFRI